MTLRTRGRKGSRQSSRRKQALENYQREGQSLHWRLLRQHHQYLIKRPLVRLRKQVVLVTRTANIRKLGAVHPINWQIMKGIVARLSFRGLKISQHNQKTRDSSISLTPRLVASKKTASNVAMMKAALTPN